MERTTSLCDALLVHVQDRAVADVVFSRSSGGRPHEAVSPAGGLSDELALKHYKGDPKKAITAVMATQSPAVLAKFSKDPRVNVRRAVAASPYISPDSATYLHDWALKRGDSETLELVLPKTPWGVALAAAPSREERSRHPWEALAASIAASGSVEAYEAARRHNHLALSIHLVKHLVTSPPAGYGLPAYLEGYSPSEVANLLSHASQEVRTLTAEFASLVDAVADELSADTPVVRGRRASTRLLPNVQRAEKDAIPVVLGSSLEQLWVALAGTDVSPSVMHRLIEKGSSDVAEVLVRQRHRSLTALMGEKMAPAIAVGAQDWAIRALLREPKVKLSSESTLLLLRAGNLECLSEWLMGVYPHKPQPGEFKALALDPQDAFCTYNRGYYARRQGNENPALAEIARRLSGRLPDIVKKPWGAEVVDALQGEFFSLVRTGHPLSLYLVERLERAFGADVSLWETALTLADSWNNGLTELLEATFLTTGEIPPSMGMLSPVIEDPVVTFGQMEMSLSL